MKHKLFIPHALRAAPIVSEGRLVRDLTMPRLDYKVLAIPTYLRRTSKLVRKSAP